jgi:hypothetical protein
VAFAAVGPMSEAIGMAETLLLAAAVGIVANAAVLFVPSVRRLERREGPVAAPDAGSATAAGEPGALQDQPASPASTASSSGSRPAK